MKENISGNAIDQRIQTGQNTLSNWNVTEFLIFIRIDKILSSARQGFFKNIHQCGHYLWTLHGHQVMAEVINAFGAQFQGHLMWTGFSILS